MSRRSALRRAELTRGVPVPAPPFWGARMIERVPVKAIVPYLNERMLYQFQWGYRKDGRSLDEYLDWAQQELRPVLHAHARASRRARTSCSRRRPTAIGRAPAEGNDLILFDDGRQHARSPASPSRARTRRTACASPISSATSTTPSAT